MKKLKVQITYTGEIASQPKMTEVDVDAEQAALNIPEVINGINVGIKTYNLWDMFFKLPNDRPDLNLEADVLLEKWIEEKILEKHPYANRLISLNWQFYNEENKPVLDKFEDFLNV